MNEQTRRAIQRQQELVNTAQAENRELTAEEQREFDALQLVIDADPDNTGGDGLRSQNTGGVEPNGGEGGSDNGGTGDGDGGEGQRSGGYTSADAAAINAMCRF